MRARHIYLTYIYLRQKSFSKNSEWKSVDDDVSENLWFSETENGIGKLRAVITIEWKVQDQTPEVAKDAVGHRYYKRKWRHDGSQQVI